MRHLLLDRIFGLASAMLAVVCHGLVVIALDPGNFMGDQEIDNLVHERSVAAEVSQVVEFVRLRGRYGLIGCLKRLDVTVYVSEYPDFHLNRPLCRESSPSCLSRECFRSACPTRAP